MSEVIYHNIHITEGLDKLLDSIKSGASYLGVQYSKSMIMVDMLEYLYSVHMGSVGSCVVEKSLITNKVRVESDSYFLYNVLFDGVVEDVHSSCVMEVYVRGLIEEGVKMVCIDNREYGYDELISLSGLA